MKAPPHSQGGANGHCRAAGTQGQAPRLCGITCGDFGVAGRRRSARGIIAHTETRATRGRDEVVGRRVVAVAASRRAKPLAIPQMHGCHPMHGATQEGGQLRGKKRADVDDVRTE
jgi:hypothetical protein